MRKKKILKTLMIIILDQKFKLSLFGFFFPCYNVLDFWLYYLFRVGLFRLLVILFYIVLHCYLFVNLFLEVLFFLFCFLFWFLGGGFIPIAPHLLLKVCPNFWSQIIHIMQQLFPWGPNESVRLTGCSAKKAIPSLGQTAQAHRILKQEATLCGLTLRKFGGFGFWSRSRSVQNYDQNQKEKQVSNRVIGVNYTQ